MEDDVLAVYLLWQDHAVLVFTVDARAVTLVARWTKQVVRRDEAHPRSVPRVPGVGDGVAFFALEIRDAGVLDAPLLVRRIARDCGTIPYLVDSLSVRRQRQAETRSP